MSQTEKICVAYTGAAVDNGNMNVNELSPALLALSNLIGEANRILNRDDSTVEVRLSAHLERGSFEMFFEIVYSIPAQIKLFFTGQEYSIKAILETLGLVSTLSGVNVVTLVQLIRWLKGRRVTKVEAVEKDIVRIFTETESKEITIGAWNLFSSKKILSHVEGVIQPLKHSGVESVEFRDVKTQSAVEKITSDEADYFSNLGTAEPVEELKTTQKLILKIISVNFERDLKWRFDDGTGKFFAEVKDEKFLQAIDSGQIAFTQGDAILAEVEVVQRYAKTDLQKTSKTITRVFKILKKIEDKEVILRTE